MATTTTALLRALLWLGTSMSALGAEVRITSVNEFIQFSSNVNNRKSYSGTTVFLDSDIDFAGKSFGPIGTYSGSNYFNGVFDGQGHVISNLIMTSSSEEVGLFGHSEGLTIKNVILDSSCSITSSYSGSYDPYVGGIIGDCFARDGPCTIENNVNMGRVSFSGKLSGNDNSLYLGGIVGYLYYNYDSTVKNCANYGVLIHSGTSSYSRIGGIIGYSSGSSSNRAYIYNSLNHGTITYNGTTSSSLYIGGIAGYTYYTTIDNCVSGGKISSSESCYIGNIAGYASSDTSINYCYYTSELSGYKKYGDMYSAPSESNILSYGSTSFELTGTVSIGNYTGTSLIDALNAYSGYYTLRNYSHWILNKEKKDVSFTINERTNPIKMDYQVILMPSLASDGKVSFDGWFIDNGLTESLTGFEVTSETELYGRFEEGISHTISFDTRREGVSVPPITAHFSSIVTLPSESIREHCVVGFWETENGDKIGLSLTMPSRNITLYAVWKCTHIETPEDFISFSKVVNNGVDSFNGTTVFLDSDLDFTGKTFEPIGTSSSYFNGVFDGQGHVISNLPMASSSQYVGLFGYSEGFTIKNVILDSSCSITSSYSGSYYNYAYVGGIIGNCEAKNESCTIENSVNMGSVAFSGKLSGSDNSLYLGGTVGYLDSSNYDSTVKSCANYGVLIHSGASGDSYIGGIVGESDGSSSSKKVYIYNCLNHGAITHSGTTNYLRLGGIAGETYSTTIENCVGAGKISLLTTPSSYNRIGSIVGWVSSDTSISYCYFTSDLSGYGKYGSGTPTSESNVLSYDSTSFELGESVSIGDYTGISLIDALNVAADYYALRDYSHWLLNKGKKDVSFTINNGTTFTLNSQIILLPSLASEGNMSFEWFTDEGLTTPLTEFEVTSDTELYGSFCSSSNYTVALDVNGGDKLAVKEMAIVCNDTYVYLPTPKRTEHTFLGWFTGRTGGDKVESGDEVTTLNNHTLYAHWSINNYTLTFVFGNGTDPEVRVLEFNETITYPTGPVREGYSFAGWDRDITSMPANNITITVQWKPNNYIVTFNPNGGSISQSTTKVVTFDSAYGELPTPTKTGHAILGWLTEKNESITTESIVETPDNHTLYAHWSINNYTLTFVFGNGTDPEVRVLEFNSSIVYPENPMREGFTFDGWDKNVTNMPANVITITALWTSPSSGGKALNTILIVGIVVPVIVLIIAIFVVVVLALYSLMKKKIEREISERRFELSEPLIDADPPAADDGYCRAVASSKEEVEGNVPKKSTQSALTYLYPKGYTRPTMKEALAGADLTEKQVRMICSACENAARIIADEGRLFEGFTEEDAAAVAMYTYDFGSKNFESNPYRIINRSLVRRNFAEMQGASGLLYLMMTALRKLPRVTGRMLYRGVRGEVSLDEGYYHKGNVVTWPALSSTSPDMEATKVFLAKGSKSGDATGTLFIIDKGWGYDIQPYSLFPDEEEILLEPERQFRVVSVLKAALTIINLEMLDTPLSVPEVFGGGGNE